MDLSVIKYIGKKDLTNKEYRILIDKLNRLDIKSYCEPFSGSFNIGLNLIEKGLKSEIYLNDVDYNIFNFWVELKNNYELLYDNILNQYDKLMIIKDKILYLEKLRNSDDTIERASGEYIFKHFSNVNGIKISNKPLNKNELDFYLNSRYLKNVNISSLDYKSIIERLDNKNSFMLLDPPYELSSNRKYYEKYSINHTELYEIIKNMKGKFILTYNDIEKIRDLYKDYNIVDITYNNKYRGREIWIHNM